MAVQGFDDRNIIGIFQDRYENRFEQSWANRLSLVNMDSNRAEEKYGIFGGFPTMREWIGARQANTISKATYSVRNKPYESTLVVWERDTTRDRSGLLNAYIGQFADGVVVNQWEDLLIDLINTNGNTYDGTPFFGTTHAFGGAAAQKNSVTATEVPALDVATATAPTATEMAGVILGLVGYMLTFKDDKGRSVNGNAKKFIVQVSTVPLYTAAIQAVTANLLTVNTDNPLNGLRAAGFTFEVQFIDRLTSAGSKVRVYREDGELKPFLLQQEQDIEYHLLGKDSEFYFENKAYKLGVDASRGAGYGLWEHAIEGTLS